MFMHPKHHSSSAAFPTEASIEEKTKTCTDWCHPTYHDDNKLFICALRHIIINTGGKGDRKILNGKRSLGHLQLLLSLAGAATSIIFVATKVFVVTNMFVMTNTCLSWQKKIFCHNTYACHDKYLLWRKFCCDMLTFVVTSVFVTTKHLFCLDKSLLSWQSMLVTTKIVCCDKYNFVTTIFFFSW